MKKILFSILFSLTALWSIDTVDTIDEALEIAKDENKIIMIMFSAEYCPTCKYMKNEVYTNSKVENYLDTYFVSMEIDVDTQDTLGYKVFGTPTYYFLRPNGSTIGRAFIGGANPEAFITKLKEYKSQK